MGATAAKDEEPGANVAGLSDDAPTQQFMGATVGDRCAACGTPLATDQKYCINCGERRGKPRFAPGTQAAPAAAAPAAAASRPPTKKQRLSSSTALVAGVGTLLLAMGVGVLIGHTDNGSSKNASAPAQIITVGGGSGGTSTGAAAATTQGKAKAAKGKASKKAKANSKPQVDKKQAAKAQAAASKVLGSSKNLPPATVKQGDTGHGPGYSKGHFTGTFFGQ